MASPPSQAPSPQENGKSSKLTYYYFVFGLTLVAIALLFANGVFLGCFSWIRRFWATHGLGRDLSEEEMRRWIPAFRYMKKGTWGEDGEDGDSAAAPECAVCISAFEEGDEARRLPQCGHSFHAACIDMWLNCHSSCPVCRGSVFPASTPSVSMEFSAQLRDNLNPRPPEATGSSVNSECAGV